MSYEKKLYKKVSQKIRERRKELKISQAKLALQLGTKQPAVSNWETGLKEISLPNLVKIANRLNCKLDYFVN